MHNVYMAQDSKIPKLEKMFQNQNYVGFDMRRTKLQELYLKRGFGTMKIHFLLIPFST